MNAKQEIIAELIKKHWLGELTRDETLLLREWMARNHRNHDFFNYVDAKDFLSREITIYEDFDKETISKRIQAEFPFRDIESHQSQTVICRTHFQNLPWLRYAAAIILLFGIGTYLYTLTIKKKDDLVQNKQANNVDILPGSNKAMLILSDGTTISLDSAGNGAIAQQGNSSIIKHKNGEIVYNLEGASNDQVMMNTMRTPRGGQYQIILPDGSRAWLNAASSITYPAAFVGKERKVKVSGEVYLEIAKNKAKPFIVDVDGKSTVQVLGTSFNINSYEDEGEIKTTLVNGSIKISSGNSIILTPGQQGIQLLRDGNIITANSNPDLDQTLAWKNGLFSFSNVDLRSAMRQLERWYDITVRYEGTISSIMVDGEMYRDITFADVLKFLEKSGLKFRMEGKTLIVL